MITQYGKTFNFKPLMEDLEDAFRAYKVPVVTLIAMQDGDPYKVLIATIISARTKDEVTIEAAKRLFKRAPTIQILATLEEEEIAQLIFPAGFYKTKAKHLKQTALILTNELQGIVPDEIDDLVKLPGVGRKTANLVVGEAFQKAAVCVDTHVHRISNRLGLLTTKTPHETEMDLRSFLPKQYWIRYNTFLVAHGQAICKPISPFCSTCKIKKYCKQIAVVAQR